MARQADAAHHIGVEKSLPVAVDDGVERLGLEDSEIVHQNVGLARALNEGGDTLQIGEIGGDTFDFRLRQALEEALGRGVHGVLASAVDDDRRAGRGKPVGDRKPNAGRRTGDDGTSIGQVDFHHVPRQWSRASLLELGSRVRPVASSGQTGDQHRQDAGQKDAVERPGAADGGDRRS